MLIPSKNQNPREGIEIRLDPNEPAQFRGCGLQKTKIPARGLKFWFALARFCTLFAPASKNQNPREGIEMSSTLRFRQSRSRSPLQKTKIPARGLKFINVAANFESALYAFPSKNQNPREGIEIRHPQLSTSTSGLYGFKKPKSPRGD